MPIKCLRSSPTIANPARTLKLLPLALGAACFQFQSQAQVTPPPSGVGVYAALEGAASYPDSGPGSFGNSISVGYLTQSGVLNGFTTATASINQTQSGTDGNGISGNTLVSGTSIATVGTLHATETVTASSTPPTSPGFVDASAYLYPSSFNTAQFWDTFAFYNPAYALGVSVPVSISLGLDWNGTFSGSGDGFVRNTVGADAIFNVAGIGGIFDQELIATSGGAVVDDIDNRPPAVNGFIQNGSTISVVGYLQIFAETTISGSSSGTTVSTATSDAAHTAHFYIDSPGAQVLDSFGYNYSSPSSVPDSTITMLELFVAAATLLAARLRVQSAKANAVR